MVEENVVQQDVTSAPEKFDRREFLRRAAKAALLLAGGIGGGSQARPGGEEPTPTSESGKAITAQRVAKEKTELQERERVRLPRVLWPSKYKIGEKTLLYANDNTDIYKEAVPSSYDLGRVVKEKISNTTELVTTTGGVEIRYLPVTEDGNMMVMFSIGDLTKEARGLNLKLRETGQDGKKIEVARTEFSAGEIEFLLSKHKDGRIEFFCLPDFARYSGENLNWDSVNEEYINAFPYTQEPSGRKFIFQRNYELGARREPELELEVVGDTGSLSTDLFPLFPQTVFEKE